MPQLIPWPKFGENGFLMFDAPEDILDLRIAIDGELIGFYKGMIGMEYQIEKLAPGLVRVHGLGKHKQKFGSAKYGGEVTLNFGNGVSVTIKS